ncbi:hypothetical protein L596_018887 [Steinernema carpocapsae]|uniref:Serine/threonine-protein phosphatase n=1 Tax=Steinernema carpocapsae TaxID=34508 RepID=A0A4U5N766_STECR|nr:hypothetical protein L596_018887 [Steinernema carpocapsae]
MNPLSGVDVATAEDEISKSPPCSTSDSADSLQYTMDRTDDETFLDDVIFRIMTAMPKPHPKNDKAKTFSPTLDVQLSIEEINRVAKLSVESFAVQKSLLRISSASLPITICGDIHGQLRDLRVVLNKCGDPSQHSYLFLGDYVDRGTEGVETVVLLFCLKTRFPKKFHLLRGNHEDAAITVCYGFFNECVAKYGNEGPAVWSNFANVFTYMPIAALINDTVFCAHGGLSPYFQSFEQIENLRRPSAVPPFGLMCDLLWSDPDARFDGYANSPRGISFTYGERIVHEFCKKTGVQLILRGHQIDREMTTGGYRSFANGRLMTIFTACNYLNMRNDGATVTIDPNMKVTFNVFRPKKIRQRRVVCTQQEVLNE